MQQTIGRTPGELLLEEALDYLKDYFKIEVFVDRHGIGNAALDKRVSWKSGETLEEILNQIISPPDATWLVRHDVVLITSAKAARAMLPIRVYKVRGRVELDALITRITEQVEPKSWADAGGPGTIRGFRRALAVRQFSFVQQKIVRQFQDVLQPVALPPAETDSKLRKPVSFAVDQMRLSEVADSVAGEHGVRIELNRIALEEIGIDADPRLDYFHLDNVPLGSALNLLAMSIDTGVVLTIRGGNLMITSREDAEANLTAQTFNFSALVGRSNLESLRDLIYSVVSPNSWDRVGGVGEIKVSVQQGAIAVRHLPSVIAEIERLVLLLQAATA